MRIVVAKDEFEGLVQHPVMKERNIPYLIIANKKDLPNGLPAIATAAVLGILLNAIFLIFKPASATEPVSDAMAAAD